MSKITPPKVPIPIGLVTIAGRQVPVQQHPEFVRFFFDLFARVGGTDGMGNAELTELIDAALSAPPQQPAVIPEFEIGMVLSRVEQAEAKIAALEGLINDLQQGVQV